MEIEFPMPKKTAALLTAFAPIVAYLLAPAAQAQTAAKSNIDKVQLEAALRHIELWIPQVQAKLDDPTPSKELPGFYDVVAHLSYNGGSIDQKYLVSGDGKKIVKGDVYDVAKNPFQGNIDKIKTDLQPSYGDAGASVVAVIFGDFQCPLCKQEAEAMRPNLTKTFGGKVRVYFKDFPLESIHPWARAASVTGRCIFRQNPQAFWKYHDWIYGVQGEINNDNLNAKVLAWADDNGVDSAQLGRCTETNATDADVTRNVAEGRALGVDATPTLFLNGRKIVGAMDWPTMERLINFELEHQAKAGEASEKCCTVEIPSLVPGKQ
jgi:protein-disulfide isomerase